MFFVEDKKKQSWFFKWVVNNKLVSILSVILLILLIVLVASQVSFIFKPIQEFLLIIGTPMIISGILFYLLNPIVNWMERHLKMSRNLSIWVLFLVVLLLISWGIFRLIPLLQAQFTSMVTNIPHYWNLITGDIANYLDAMNVKEIPKQLTTMNKNIYQSLANFGQQIFSNGFAGLNSMVSIIASIVIVIITVPFILYYLLRDGRQLVPSVMKYLPPKFREPTRHVLIDINHQLASYIRGQITVAICVFIIYMLGFSICGFKYAIVMGALAGVLNLIPYLGSWLTMIPVIILAFVTGGPIMVLKVLIVHLIEQVVESRILQPMIISSQLEMHPLTIIFVLLTAGKLFGVIGVVLGIPGYAVLKVIGMHIFHWYEKVSPLYNENPEAK